MVPAQRYKRGLGAPPRGARSGGHDYAKPHAQQQLARDLEVERAAMGQCCRPESSGPGLLCAAARFGFAVLKNNLSLLEGLDFTPAASATTKLL